MSVAATPTADLDAALEHLRQRRGAWLRVDARERAALLRACLAGVRRAAPEWVGQVCAAKGIDPESPLAGEAWLSGPMTTIRCLRVTAAALHANDWRAPAATRERAGQAIVEVTPDGPLEKLVLAGITAEVWIQPGAEPRRGRIYRDRQSSGASGGGVALVLGAGNISAIAPRDLVHKLCVEDEVVVLKMHPVNAYLGPVFERAFAPLIEAGFLQVVYGGAEEGAYLCRHELVTSIHLTGSHHTHDAIVWGSSEDERRRRKATGAPVIDKHVTSELGCVSPVIVVPGEWTDAELEFQARTVAGMVTHNASFNCTAAKALVLQAQWRLRERFVDRLREILAATPQRRAYYPGSADRYRRFCAAYAGAQTLGPAAAHDTVPWTLIPDLAPRREEYALGNEAFCGILAEVPVPAADAGDFLAQATRVANDEIWGNLSCNLLIDPRTERDLATDLDQAVADLRYGGVAINTWSSVLFGLSSTSWGAFPGNTLDDVRSGIGTVGNALMFDRPQKSVARAPFKQWPIPPWLPGHGTLRSFGRLWTEFEARPSWRKLPAMAWTAARA